MRLTNDAGQEAVIGLKDIQNDAKGTEWAKVEWGTKTAKGAFVPMQEQGVVQSDVPVAELSRAELVRELRAAGLPVGGKIDAVRARVEELRDPPPQQAKFSVEPDTDQAQPGDTRPIEAAANQVKPSMKTIGKAIESFKMWVAQWVMFGEAYWKNPGLYQSLKRTQFAQQAAVPAAIREFQDAVKDFDDVKHILKEGDENIAFALEEKGGRDNLDERQQKIYDVVHTLREKSTDIQVRADVIEEGGWLVSTDKRLHEEMKDPINRREKAQTEIKGSIEALQELEKMFAAKSITANQKKILAEQAEARLELARAERSKNQAKITEVQKKLDKLAQFEGYVTHVPVLRAVLRAKFRDSDHTTRKNFVQQLEQFHSQRGRLGTLREYTETIDNKTGKPLLSAQDVNPLKLGIEMLASAYSHVAVKQLIDDGKEMDLILHKNNPDAKSSWWTAGQVKGLSGRGLDDMLINPLLARSIEDLTGADHLPRTAFDKLLAMTKIGQFYRPGIIFSYNVIQPFMRGVWSINPLLVIPAAKKAWTSVLTGDQMNRDLRKYGVFQKPGLASQAEGADLIDLAVRQYQEDIAPHIKYYEKTTGGRWDKLRPILKANPGSILEALQAPYRAMSAITWKGDEIQRTMSFLIARGQYEFKDMNNQRLATYIGDAHGAYGKMSTRYRDVMSRIFFVHTFRVLMPQEVGKSMYGLPALMGKAIFGKKNITGNEWARNVKAMMSTVAIPIIVHQLMKANGYEPDEDDVPTRLKEFIGKIPIGLPFPTYQNHWKYKKVVTNPDGQQREIVVGVNHLTNMPWKWLHRFSQDKPQKLDDHVYHLLNVVKWELNPLYRIVADAVTNEASMGDVPPSNPQDSATKRLTDMSRYVFGNMFRMYHPVLIGMGTTAQRREAKRDLGAALNGWEKALLGYYGGYAGPLGTFNPASFGYVYTRKERRVRMRAAQNQLSRAIAGETGRVKRDMKDRPDDMRKALNELRALKRKRMARIQNIFMGTNSDN